MVQLGIIMKKLLAALLGAFTLVATVPAVAGPDWQLIEKGRQAKQEEAAAAAFSGKMSGSGTSAMGRGPCTAEPLVLPLDHGPRAQTTPAMNEKRRQAYEAQRMNCPHTAR